MDSNKKKQPSWFGKNGDYVKKVFHHMFTAFISVCIIMLMISGSAALGHYDDGDCKVAYYDPKHLVKMTVSEAQILIHWVFVSGLFLMFLVTGLGVDPNGNSTARMLVLSGGTAGLLMIMASFWILFHGILSGTCDSLIVGTGGVVPNIETFTVVLIVYLAAGITIHTMSPRADGWIHGSYNWIVFGVIRLCIGGAILKLYARDDSDFDRHILDKSWSSAACLNMSAHYKSTTNDLSNDHTISGNTDENGAIAVSIVVLSSLCICHHAATIYRLNFYPDLKFTGKIFNREYDKIKAMEVVGKMVSLAADGLVLYVIYILFQANRIAACTEMDVLKTDDVQLFYGSVSIYALYPIALKGYNVWQSLDSTLLNEKSFSKS
jgi:hypothetical protein